MAAIPALRRQRQDGQKFQASLSYIKNIGGGASTTPDFAFKILILIITTIT